MQTQVAALQNGEIDMIESPGHDLLPLLAKDKSIKISNANPLGNQYVFRFNSTAKPFDNAKIRHAVMVAFGQEDFLKATIGDPKYYKVCKAVFICGTPLATEDGMEDVLNGNAAKAKELAEGGGLRRHANRAAAVDRSAGTDQPGPGRQVPARAGRLQGRHAADGLAVGGRAPRQEGPVDKGGWKPS